MEDVLELHAEPYDPQRPVVNFDEASKELRDHVTPPVGMAPGQAAKEDYEYRRAGTANLFVVVEPLAGRRHVTVTDRRTIPDFAAQMKFLCDDLYPGAEVIRVEFHYTPKHASWLNMAELELSVLSRQCLNRRISDPETLRRAIAAWQAERNAAGVPIIWSFRVPDARKKLAHLYPQELVR